MTAKFSAIIPTYNVAPYLDEFLDSLAEQTYPLADIDLIFVNDGSTDSSGDVIRDWIDRVVPTATLLDQPNGGLSSARNAGLDRAIGDWVTFPDPDDRLPPEYFASVAEFIAQRKEELQLVVTHAVILEDRTGELIDEHPLRFRFEKGRHVVDLERHPTYFHIQAASAFFHRAKIDELGLRFDHRVQPNFEDGHLVGQYLADQERPLVGFLDTPLYHYRRRSDRSSLVQNSWHRPDKFTQVTRHGYLDLLERVVAKRGTAPIWLQNMVLYDVLWYFKHDERIHSTLGALDSADAEEFHEILPRIMQYIDVATIEDYRITRTSVEVRNALIIGAKGERQRPDRLRIARIDPQKQIATVRYFYGGDLPHEEFRGRGLLIEPVYAKSRSIAFLKKQLASERIVWLPANGTIQISIDGRRMPIELGSEPRARYLIGPTEMWRRLTRFPPPSYDRPQTTGPRPLPAGASVARRIRRAVGNAKRMAERYVERVRASVGRVEEVLRRVWTPRFSTDARFVRRARGLRGRKYRSAWVFIDRAGQAQDNAEHLYRYVQQHRPDINAWFVIDRDTKDWSRLARQGFRLVDHGSTEHTKLLLNTVHLISSQVDHYIVRPLDTDRYGHGRWRFTFLQHGVTKDDLSRWLNPKPISCLITATEAEHQSFVGDGTPYKFTDKEVELTGFPRHDRLLAMASDRRIGELPRLLILMPTWRRELLGAEQEGGRPRQAGSGFWKSAYAHNWMDLVRSDRLRDLADRAGLRVAFVPHPNMAVFLAGGDLPDHVDVYHYDDVDIQEIFARGAVAITDYSSNAFEMAYIDRPVIYFQFDQKEFFSGQHAYRQGDWWSYEHDGFGPVAVDGDRVLDELQCIVDNDVRPLEPYATRIKEGFAFRDGECCARTVAAIEEITRPLPYARAFRRIDG